MPRLHCTCVQCLLVAAALGGIVGCTHVDREHATTSPNSAVAPTQPSIQLLDLENHPFDLWQKQQGHVTVVLFTRTDCPISNRFAPEIRGLFTTYHPRGVDFYLIYVDPHEQPDAIRQHLKDYQYPCSGLRDPSHTLVAYCQAVATPEAVVFSKDRTIVYRGRISDRYADLGQPRAQATKHDLADAIESTLLGQPVAVPRTKAIGCSIADLKE